VLLGNRLVLVNGMVVDGNGLVSDHGLGRHGHVHGPLAGDSPRRASSMGVPGRAPCLLALHGVSR
jgi:hypothetical protein